MKKMLLGLSLVALAGCDTYTYTPPKATKTDMIQLTPSQFDTIKKLVKGNLKDPGSAQFGDYIAFRATYDSGGQNEIVCGYVNAKNSFGGYVGGRPYIAMAINGTFRTVDGPSEYMMSECQRTYGVSI